MITVRLVNLPSNGFEDVTLPSIPRAGDLVRHYDEGPRLFEVLEVVWDCQNKITEVHLARTRSRR